ncbi:uncharacterized protein LOC127868199 isoform X2 [Dreissena polymorpha]|uniref:uncharacterized protein LOC127868199 isoform X2 n=1 Tax=Dreissena polymorpha TaxID=45954 RepID=UPI0022643AB0|nr:uncharacterized protein LOC127868199 isoform X2 [Dreissena polymorpha]
MSKTDQNDLQCIKNPSIQETRPQTCVFQLTENDKTCVLNENQINITVEESKSTPDLYVIQNETSILRKASDSLKVERSIFENLSIEDPPSFESKNESVKYKEVDNEKISLNKSDVSFGIFGKFMESFKLQEVLEQGNEKDKVSKVSNKIIDEDTKSESGESDIRERNERNLFDLIVPKDEPLEEIVESKSLFKPMKRSTRSTTRASTVSSENSESPRASKKKPMFKFPKIALNVNFGDIAKLGLTKLKQEGKIKSENDVKLEVKSNEKSAADWLTGDKILETFNIVTDDVVQAEADTKKMADTEKNEAQYTGVVMETFQQLRQRLMEDRIAQKAEKAKHMQDDNTVSGDSVAETITTEDHKEDIETGPESDDEMYKEFTPQKIVLILEISKKHGIAFASTSFGLPAHIIVNWIIEKDRKHRKVSISVSLEEKLTVVQRLANKEDIQAVANDHKVEKETIETWKNEVGWLLEKRGIQAVLEKWKKVETVSEMKLNEEFGKKIERQVSSNKQDTSKLEDAEISMCSDCTVDKGEKIKENPDEGDITAKESITPTNIETNNKDTEILNTLDDHAPIQNETSGLKTLTEKNKDKPEVDVRNDTSEVGKEEELSAPKVLLFARNTNPTFFTVEQKAMCVLLTEKYGINKVSKKLGISNGTLWRWMNRKTVISDLIEEHKAGYKKVKHIEETTSVTSESKNKEKKIVKGTYKQTFDIPEIAISTRSRTVAKENEVKSQRTKGYRSISPSKLPAVLQNIENLNSKDYSVEQKLAVLKLVELYGVRQIHKQFRLPTSCIWNWQNSKEVIDKLNDGKPVRKTFETASESVDDAEEDSEVELNIDVILDRTLVAVESVDYMNFKVSQKADVVYLIHHFGIEYVCEKLPQIPRGTLWNWRQSRHVLPIVDEITAAIKWAKERKRTGVVHMDRVVSHKVDKRDLTQKWLSECEVPAGGERKRKSTREGSIESAKRKKMEESEIRSEIADSERILRASSTSSVCSLISVHSDDDFEEILSDTEISSPSVRSKRSVASVPTSQGSMHSKKGNQSLVKGSSGKENSQKTGSVQETTNDSLTVKIQEPIYEVISIEPDRSDRLMVCYKVSTNAILSKPTEPGSKRALSDTTSSAQPPAKKKTVNPEKDEDFTHVEDKTVFFKSKEGKLVPLEEFYYGTLEGDANFTEEKGEFRFKCWYCSKMLYNNVRAMQHIQGHITSSKQQNIDLSDLTQCKHCFKQFDTPFEMQTHVEKVHLSNKVLMCRICEQDFTTSRLLANHMRLSHFPSEMPYLCQLCSFRSSMYSDVVDHFKKKHDSSCNLLCLYCLRTFDVKFVSQGWGQTQTYYGHLLKHQSKTSNKKCPLCRLTFFNAQDVKNHRKSCHVMMNREASGFSPGGKQDTSARQKKSNLKSLNAPSVSKILDYGDVKFPTETQTAKCVECKMVMASADHYKKFIHCSMCRFATSCSVAYANHMLGFHSGQMSSLNLNIPWERPAQQALYCACGFSTRYGNKLANHLVFCTKAVCYTSKPDTMEDSDDTATAMKDAEKSSDSSVLGVLGLVQKKPEFMSRPGPKSKSRALQKTRPESRFANVINLTKEVLLSKEKILNVIDITEDKTEDKDKPNMKMTDTNDVPNVGESKFKGDVDKEQIEDKEAVFAVDEAKNVIEGRDKKTEINEVRNEDNLKQEYKTENKTEFAEIQGIIKLIPAEENVTTDHDEEGQTKEMKLDLKEVIDLAEDDTDHQLETENKTEDHKEARQAEQLINVTEKEEQTKKMKRDLKEVIDLAEDDTDHQLETENKTKDHKEARQAEQLINATVKDGVDKEEDAVNETTEKMEVSIEESRKDVDNLNNEESVSSINVDDVAEESADDIVDGMAEDASMKESEAPDANVVAREPEPVIKEATEKPEESQIEEISEMQTDEKINVLESDEKTEEEVGKKSDQSEHLSLSEPIKVQSEVGDKESQSKEKSLSDSNKNNSDEHRDSRNSAERSHDRRSSEHGSGRRSEESRGSYDDRQRSRDSSERSRDRHNSNQDHRRSEERYRHDNRSHESNSSSNDRDRSHERDRDYNRNRDYHQGDSRYGDSRHGDKRYGGGNRGSYSHADNRDYHGNQGQRGQHGYQDNRGSYSRGGYNRGGHNPNYRGSYQGGYY